MESMQKADPNAAVITLDRFNVALTDETVPKK